MMKNFLLCFLLVFSWVAHGQIDYSRQYSNGKALYRDGKYALAMETFKPLTVYDKSNPYSAYASFYYALAAYHQRFNAVAKDMLTQIKTLHPQWDKTSEVNFWLGKILFENKDYFQAMKTLALITDKNFEKDVDALKAITIATIADAETLRMLHEEYPKDAVIGKQLATALAKNVTDEETKKELEQLISKFKLTRAEFIPEAPKSFFKEKYSVAMLLPFMVSTLEPTPGRKRTQIVLDFYEGAKLAVDTLQKQGVNISLRAYDTERSVDKLKKYLETEELKRSDLIIGPLFPEESKVVQEFSIANKINMIHPVSNSTDFIGVNPYAFLFQPSAETLGKKSAGFLADRLRKKDCMVFFGPTKKDSTLAASFIAEAQAKGITILGSFEINPRETAKVNQILTTATEFDEFKYASEFTLKKDSLHSIFVASDDPLIYTKIVGARETRADSSVLVGSENWLDDNVVEFDKYQTLGIVLTAPNYKKSNDRELKAFERKYLLTHGKQASNMARLGFELLIFAGQQLKQHGVYFQEGLQKAGVIPGYMGEGFDYRFGRDNQLVPFTTFKMGEQTLIEKR
jgi:tetratricopeptide (TPR) repeat protein